MQKRERRSQQERLAAEQRQDREEKKMSVETVLKKLFQEKEVWTASKLNQEIADAGFEPTSGSTARVRSRLANYDGKDHSWRRK